MNSSNDEMNRSAHIGRQLRRLAGTEANRRHLLELPLFQVERKIPNVFERLLKRLDSVENDMARR
jgi:hypothetical protein